MNVEKEVEVLEMWDAGVRDMDEFTTNTDLTSAAVKRILKSYGRISKSGHSAEDIQGICNDYQSDMPVKEVLAKWGLKTSALYSILTSNNIPIRAYSKEAQGVKETQSRTAVSMYKAGAKVTTIYQETGISPNKLYDLLRTEGVALRSEDTTKKVLLEKAVKLYSEGQSLGVIEAATQVNPTALYKALRAKGATMKGHGVAASKIEEAVALYRKGTITSEIVNNTGVSITALYKALRAKGVGLRRVVGAYPIEVLDEAVEMYQKGHTLGLIFDRTRVPSKTLYKELTARGLELRP